MASWGLLRITVLGLATVLAVQRAAAAELRVELAELAQVVTRLLDGARLRLHNAPGDVPGVLSGSSVTVAGDQIPVPVPVHTFDTAGARYAFYLTDVSSRAIGVAAAAGALRFRLEFEDEDAELRGVCLAGACPPAGSVPEIEWLRPAVTVDLAPVRLGEGLSLEAVRVGLEGELRPNCRAVGGFLSGAISAALCRLVLPQARQAVARLKAGLDEGLKQQLNAPAVQERLAAALQELLRAGGGGTLRVRSVGVDSGVLKVDFCLAC